MDIIKLEKFIYLQKVNCDFSDINGNKITFGSSSQFFLLITNKSIYFLREYEKSGSQNFNNFFNNNLENFLKINHENFNLSSYHSSVNSESFFYIRIKNNILNIKISECIQNLKRKNVKRLANILAIFDGYKIVCRNQQKSMEDYIDWLINLINFTPSENKIIINNEFFKNINLDFLSDMIYFLTIYLEFEIKLNLFNEENIVQLNYILTKHFEKLCPSNEFQNKLKIYLQSLNYSNSIINSENESQNYFMNLETSKKTLDNIDSNNLEAELKLGSLNVLRFSYNLLNDNHFFFLFKNLENSLFFLKELEVSNNNITESIFPMLNLVFRDKNNCYLQKLILNNNLIRGINLEKNLLDIMNLKNLKLIDLSNNLLDNQFLLKYDSYINEIYNEFLNNRGLVNNLFSIITPSNITNNQDSNFTNNQNSFTANTNNMNNINNRFDNKLSIIFNKNCFEDEYKNESFYKQFASNINTKINTLYADISHQEKNKDKNLFYSVRQFIENTSKFKFKISFTFDNHLIKDSKNFLNNKEINEISTSNKLETANIKQHQTTNISGNYIYSKTIKKEFDLKKLFINNNYNFISKENNEIQKSTYVYNKSNSFQTDTIFNNLQSEEEIDKLKFFYNLNDKLENGFLMKNYDIDQENTYDLLDLNDKEKNLYLEESNENKNILELYEEMNELFFLCDYLFDEKLNDVNLDFNSKKCPNFNEVFYLTKFKTIEKNFKNYEKERLKFKMNSIKNDNSSSSPTMNNSLNISSNKNLLYIKISNLTKENVSKLFKKHFFGKELDKFHPNADIHDLKSFFLTFKKLNNYNCIRNFCFKNLQKVKIPFNSLHKFFKRVKINTLFALKFNDLFSLNILKEICDYFNLNFSFRASIHKKILINRAEIINYALKSVINFKGHSDKNYKDPYFLHSINNFLDIFLEFADEINLKNDLVNIAKYLKIKRDLYIDQHMKKLYINALREDDLISSNSIITTEFDPINKKYFNLNDPLLLRIPAEIFYKFLSFHPVNVDYLRLANAKYELLKRDLVNISKLVNEDQSYGIRNIYDRIHFMFCKCKFKIILFKFCILIKASNETNSKEKKYNLNKKNPFLKLARYIFRFKNNLALNSKIKNYISYYLDNNINISEKYVIDFNNDIENEKNINSKIKSAPKKLNSIYEISRIKKVSSLKNFEKDSQANEKSTFIEADKNSEQICDLGEMLQFRKKLLKFNEDKKLEESLIDFSIEYKKQEQILFLEGISKAHGNFLYMCFDENSTIYFFSEQEKKKRASLNNNVVVIHTRQESESKLKEIEQLSGKKSISSRPLITNIGSRKTIIENIEFENVLNIGVAGFLIKNFIDHYINLTNFKTDKNEEKNQLFYFKSNDETKNEAILDAQFKFKEFIDEDICLLVLRHINRESFPKEEFPIKYILIFLILILPQMNFTLNFRNQLNYWICYVAEKQ